MPDWYPNTLKVRFPNKASKDAFKAKYLDDKGELDFNKIIPEPQHKDECDEDCLIKGNDGVEIFIDRPWFNWYKWQRKHWGVKWGACNTFIAYETDTELEIDFDTAYYEPSPSIITKLKADNPTLRLSLE